MAEYNIALVFLIGALVKEHAEDFEISLHLSVTTRRQDAWLWSFFHHHSHLTGTFSSFVDRSVLQAKEDYLGLQYFQCLDVYRKISGDKWEIKAIPFELLSMDAKADKYLEEVFFLNKGQVGNIDISKENSKTNNGNKNFLKANRYSLVGRIGYRLTAMHNLSSPTKIARFANKLSLVLLRIDRELQKILPKTVFAEEPPEEVSEKIKQHFLEDNIKLQEAMKNYDLERYGYI